MIAVITAGFLPKPLQMLLRPMELKFSCLNPYVQHLNLSFTIRHLKCQGGVVCTASHNPKEYNGYKAYWNDGGQLVPPHDKNVINEVEKIASVDDVKWSGGEKNITMIGKEMDEAYMKMVKVSERIS